MFDHFEDRARQQKEPEEVRNETGYNEKTMTGAMPVYGFPSCDWPRELQVSFTVCHPVVVVNLKAPEKEIIPLGTNAAPETGKREGVWLGNSDTPQVSPEWNAKGWT